MFTIMTADERAMRAADVWRTPDSVFKNLIMGIIPATDCYKFSNAASEIAGFNVVLAPRNSFKALGYNKTREQIAMERNANGTEIGIWRSETEVERRARSE